MSKGEVMKRKSVAVALVAACSFLSVPSVVQAQDAEAQRLAARAGQESHPELRKAIQDLQAARYELTRANRTFAGERGDATKQLQTAMDELFAAVGDKQWEEQDKTLRETQRREGREAWQARRDQTAQQPVTSDQEFTRMTAALEKLSSAERRLDELGGGFEGRKAKALASIRDAKVSINEGIEKARADAKVQADDRAQTAAAQAGSHPELRKVIEELQAARYELSRADRKFFTERGDARQQVEFAMTQLFAAVGDKQWEEQDKQMWEKQKREGDRAPGRQDDRLTQEPGQNQPYFRMQNALKRLETARLSLEKAETTDPQHKNKALTFIREAEKAINIGIEKAREAAKAEQT